ncbi:hypothetical protein Bbelb_036620 [Branchiostoma belcheri]|nr:hypothetical protein Bbelb_036620 [Branchiostoma belcheri]
MDCSHGGHPGFPPEVLIPSSTETFLMNDNLMTIVPPTPVLLNLLELSLEDNSITTLERSPFRLRPNLQILRLGGNKITNVVSGAFDGLSQLLKLYLNRNNIETVEAFAGIDSPSSLEMLDLQGNKLTSIAISMFTGVPLLTELNLSSNNISTIEDGSFSGLKKLRVLYLHSNQILRLTNETFMGLSSLKSLVLADNKIQNLPDMVFNGAIALEFLDLVSNGISKITRKTFSGLFNLTALSLDSNNISTVEDGAFRNLVKLHTLSMFKNSLQDISASTFIGLAPDDRTDNTGLEVLYVSRNRLTADNEITSEGLEDGSFANLGNLVYLSLYGNRLTNISAATFQASGLLQSTEVEGRPLSNLRQEDLQMSCPTTTDPPPTESTVQTCPTSLTTEVMTSPRPVTTPSSTTPPSSSFTTRKPGTCTAPTDITVQNVQDSRAEITWLHNGKSINVDLTGFIIEYQIFGQKSWKDTQKVHADERYFTMVDLVPSTPYQACVAVLCKGKNIQAGKDHCVPFTTKMRSTTIVGLAVGIPLLLVILCLVAAVAIALKKRGPFSSKHEAGHTPERPQLQEANHSKTGAVGTIEDPPYNSINDNPQVRPDRENRYQNAGFEEEPGADGITSSYLDLGQAGDVLNSAADEPHHDAPFPVPRDDRRPSSSSFNNPVYAPDSVDENIYTRVNDDGLEGTMARSSSAEEDVYIDVIA